MQHDRDEVEALGEVLVPGFVDIEVQAARQD